MIGEHNPLEGAWHALPDAANHRKPCGQAERNILLSLFQQQRYLNLVFCELIFALVTLAPDSQRSRLYAL
jgi:hypothetical protein